MAYRVIVQSAALTDATEYTNIILSKSDSAEPARRWIDGLESSIQGLTDMPTLHRKIDEQDAFDIELRQITCHSHRVIYHVDEKAQSVHVLRIYHGARRELSPGDIPDVGR